MSAHDGKTVANKDGCAVVDCVACGFTHVHPLPTVETLKHFYADEFYEKEVKEYFKETEEDRDWWMLTYNHYYDLLEQHTSGKRLLDIGSGPGLFLECGTARGWKTLGVEASPQAAAYAQSHGGEVIVGLFNAEELASRGPFDVVALTLVLEHLPNPAEIVAQAHTLLAPGGVLFVVVPNDFNPLQKLLVDHHGYAPWWIEPKHHLNYFSIGSIASLLESSGLRVVEKETTYPMEFFLLSGRNYVENPHLGRACHAERKQLESALYREAKGLIGQMFRDWAGQGIGREVVIIGKKE